MNEKLSSTQKGKLAENIIANALMIESEGRLSPFQPVADDDGIDVLIYDKKSFNTIPLQIKSRTSTIKLKSNVRFEVREKVVNTKSNTYYLFVLLKSNMRDVEMAWFFSTIQFCKNARKTKTKFTIAPNRSSNAKDRFSKYQCVNFKEVISQIIDILEK